MYLKRLQENSIQQRALDILYYTIQNNANVRATAKAFGISKTTVHKDSRNGQINFFLKELKVFQRK